MAANWVGLLVFETVDLLAKTKAVLTAYHLVEQLVDSKVDLKVDWLVRRISVKTRVISVIVDTL